MMRALLLIQVTAALALVLDLADVSARHIRIPPTPYPNEYEDIPVNFICPGVGRYCFCPDTAKYCQLDMTLTYDGTSIFLNGVSPSPTLIVTESQILKFHVTNNIDDDNGVTSIHWHGMFQLITSYMDGMGMLSHRSIPLGTSFDYIFKAEPKGTMWYHSHTGSQRTAGMFGALIVKDPEPPQIYAGALQNSKPQHTTILLDGDFPIKLNYTKTQYNVDRGTDTYFRLIGGMSSSNLQFFIEGHTLKVVAIDGFYIAEEEVDYISIHAGERYDFILHAGGENKKYRMAAINHRVDPESTGATVRLEAVLNYNGATETASIPRDCVDGNSCKEINCPYESFPPSSYIDCVYLDHIQALVASELERTPEILPMGSPDLKFFNFQGSSAINNVKHRDPTTAYQTNCEQYDSDKEDLTDFCLEGDYCESCYDTGMCIHAVEIGGDYTFGGPYPSVNFVFTNMNNTAFGYHPAHLHGHSYHVVRIGYGTYDFPDDQPNVVSPTPDITCKGDSVCRSPDYANPGVIDGLVVSPYNIRKDTIIVPGGGYVIVAFHADNPGYWFMHCHIEAHQLNGMAIIVQEHPKEFQWYPPQGINDNNFQFTFDEYDRITNRDDPFTCPPYIE